MRDWGVRKYKKAQNGKHPKCKGFMTQDIGWGNEFECGYDTILTCDECKYGVGTKDPNAKANKLKP